MTNIRMTPHSNPDFNGSLDDVLAKDVKYIHIEQMDTDYIWMCIDNENFRFYIDKGRLYLRHSWTNPTKEEANE